MEYLVGKVIQCNLPDCDCGWNITIAGKTKDELAQLKSHLKSIIEEDKTDYAEKINQEKF